ncbi:hypothetical protein EDB86DRAFT_2841049 [Lactarius hatsudake]|nr:hypothetical protein EDB86DRAFT_2841049 [Lactarius hatsudake]
MQWMAQHAPVEKHSPQAQPVTVRLTVRSRFADLSEFGQGSINVVFGESLANACASFVRQFVFCTVAACLASNESMPTVSSLHALRIDRGHMSRVWGCEASQGIAQVSAERELSVKAARECGEVGRGYMEPGNGRSKTVHGQHSNRLYPLPGTYDFVEVVKGRLKVHHSELLLSV